jgi:hypothetical protein
VQWHGHGIQCRAVAMAWITVKCGGIGLDYSQSAVEIACAGLQCSAVVMALTAVKGGGIDLDYSAVRW